MEKMYLDRQTTDGTQLTIAQLAKICPAAITEVADPKTGNICRKVNFDMLRLMLGDLAVENPHEVYDFTWVGKTEAARNAAKSITKTLRPCESESVDWENTQNLYIEGENLEVLKLLQNSYDRSIKMIYIDPPYNTGKDFIYQDDRRQTQSEYDKDSGAKDEFGNRYRRNTDTCGRFHSKWCSMMYERLLACRSMLTDDGVIFVSIDDHEATNLKKICDEVFGESNLLYYLSVVNNLNGNDNSHGMMETQEYCLIYAKYKGNVEFGVLPLEEDNANDWLQDELGYWKVGRSLKATGINAPREARPNLFYTVYINEDTLEFTTDEKVGANWYHLIPLTEGREMRWYWSKETLERDKKEVIVKKTADGYSLYKKQRPALGDLPSKRGKTTFYSPKYANANSNAEIRNLFEGKKVFDYTKSTQLIKDFISIANVASQSVILDFFSGAATTAHAVMQLNAEDGGHRKFIMVQLPEKTDSDELREAYKAGYKDICEIGKERIRRAGSKIKEQYPEVDTGFRVLKVDETNYKQVAFTPNEFTQGMIEGLIDNIKDDRNDLDLLFECMLRWGVKLSEPISKSIVDNCSILNVNDGDLVACLDRQGKITEQVIDAIAEMHPLRVVLLDVAFNEASQKMNIFEQFKQHLGWQDNDVAQKIRVI